MTTETNTFLDQVFAWFDERDTDIFCTGAEMTQQRSAYETEAEFEFEIDDVYVMDMQNLAWLTAAEQALKAQDAWLNEVDEMVGSMGVRIVWYNDDVWTFCDVSYDVLITTWETTVGDELNLLNFVGRVIDIMVGRIY